MRKSRKKRISLFMAGILVTGCLINPMAAEAKKKKVDLNGTYHAALGISTATGLGINRNAYYSKKVNAYYKTDQWNMLMSEDSETSEPVEHKGNFIDAVIKGNGTYTVKLKKADFDGETTISMLHVATDIPVNNKIKFSNVSAKINGKIIVTFDEPYMEEEKQYLSGGMDILLMNHRREELVQQLAGRGVTEGGANGYDLLKGTGNDTVEIKFTVDGFNYDKGKKQPEETKPTPTPEVETEEPTPTVETYSPEPDFVDSEEKNSDITRKTPTASVPIIVVVVTAVALCGVVVVIVNGRSKRK